MKPGNNTKTPNSEVDVFVYMSRDGSGTLIPDLTAHSGCLLSTREYVGVFLKILSRTSSTKQELWALEPARRRAQPPFLPKSH